MLYINVGEIPKDCIVNVNSYFNRKKKRDWFNRHDVKDIILGIDNSVAVKDEYIESPVFGGMSPDRLSGGCKAVILMAVTDLPIYATKCGDNCIPYIVRLSEVKDIHITLHHCMRFPREFNAIMEQTGERISNWEEWVNAYYRSRHNR